VQIVLLTPQFSPHFEGGTEAVARAQAREFARRGHAVRVISGTDRPHDGRDVLHERVDGIPVAFLPRRGDENYDLDLERPRLVALVRELTAGAQIAHVHHWSTLHAALVRDLAARCPVVVTLHDLFVTCPRFFRLPIPLIERCPERGDLDPCARCVAPETSWTKEQLLAALERRTRWVQAELDAAAALVVPSRAQAETLRRYVDLDPERVSVVPHGLSRPLRRARLAPWNGTEPLRVLFLGHRSDVKGTRDLVRALAALGPSERARVELVLLGDEVAHGHDAELAREAGALELVFAGDYSVAELPERLEAAGGAHLGAFPSRAWESYGLVVDELFALGLPVWCSDRGAPQERVGAAGRILPAEDPAAWTRAFAGLLADPAELERERRALPAGLRTAADAARELEALYERLVRAR
jgi:glycosyltransferase involved in cell wall biosynthesis